MSLLVGFRVSSRLSSHHGHKLRARQERPAVWVHWAAMTEQCAIPGSGVRCPNGGGHRTIAVAIAISLPISSPSG